MMESAVMIDILLGILMLGFGFILKRIFQLFDKLAEEDKLLHSRITDLSTASVSRQELQGALDRLLRSFESRMDKMEERLLSK
ncbi:MAG: hypothetical protein P8M25_20930 [Paracoccaceae bacterium]|nr:hypothetical protein [Paracoccaceae bacterium]